MILQIYILTFNLNSRFGMMKLQQLLKDGRINAALDTTLNAAKLMELMYTYVMRFSLQMGQLTKFWLQIWTTLTLCHTCDSSYFR